MRKRRGRRKKKRCFRNSWYSARSTERPAAMAKIIMTIRRKVCLTYTFLVKNKKKCTQIDLLYQVDHNPVTKHNERLKGSSCCLRNSTMCTSSSRKCPSTGCGLNPRLASRRFRLEHKKGTRLGAFFHAGKVESTQARSLTQGVVQIVDGQFVFERPMRLVVVVWVHAAGMGEHRKFQP